MSCRMISDLICGKFTQSNVCGSYNNWLSDCQNTFLFMCCKHKYQLPVILFIIHGNNTSLTNNHSSGSPGIDSQVFRQLVVLLHGYICGLDVGEPKTRGKNLRNTLCSSWHLYHSAQLRQVHALHRLSQNTNSGGPGRNR